MSKQFSFNQVQLHRKRAALTLEELAFLVGNCAGSATSAVENGIRPPSIMTAFALQVLFGQQLPTMFPDLYEAVEEAVMQRAADLYERLEGKDDTRSRAKRDFLDSIPSRGLDNVIEA